MPLDDTTCTPMQSGIPQAATHIMTFESFAILGPGRSSASKACPSQRCLEQVLCATRSADQRTSTRVNSNREHAQRIWSTVHAIQAAASRKGALYPFCSKSLKFITQRKHDLSHQPSPIGSESCPRTITLNMVLWLPFIEVRTFSWTDEVKMSQHIYAFVPTSTGPSFSCRFHHHCQPTSCVTCDLIVLLRENRSENLAPLDVKTFGRR